jgi:hypothetical protein
MNRKSKLLILLLLLLGLALAYAWGNWPRRQHVSPSQPVGKAVRPADAPPPGQQPAERVPLELLEPPEAPEKPVTRNIFAPLFTPAKAVTRTDRAPSRQARQKPPRRQPAAPAVTVPRPVFLGLLQHAEGAKAFLEVAGEVFVVGPGERFGKAREYQLLELDAGGLRIAGAESNGSIFLPIEEQPVSVTGRSGSGASFRARERQVAAPAVEERTSAGPAASERMVPADESVEE